MIKNRNIDPNAAIAGSKLAAGAVDTTQLADGAVTSEKLDSGVTDLLTIIENIPTSNQSSPAIWNDNGVLKVGTA